MKPQKTNLTVRTRSLTVRAAQPRTVFVIRTSGTAVVSATPTFKVSGLRRIEGPAEAKEIRNSSAS